MTNEGSFQATSLYRIPHALAVTTRRSRKRHLDANSVFLYTIAMPTISRFFGIAIEMFWREHNPPHFHATYAEDEAVFEIESLDIIRGQLPHRAQALVKEWAELHREALLENWELCSQLKPPNPVPPLE